METYSRDFYRKRLSLELAVSKSAPKRIGFNAAEDTPKLLQIRGDQEFVEAAYEQILGRAADDAGLAGYLDALRNKTSRREVIQRLASSEEARRWAGVDADEFSESSQKAPMMQRLREGVVGKARHLLNQILLSRFDSIDFRLAFLTNNLAERDQNLTKKLEDSLKALHDKLELRLAAGGVVEDGVTRLWKSRVKPGAIVVDVGSHSGHFTSAAAGAAKIHSFEPDPTIEQQASGNTHFHPEAVSDSVGAATLAIFPEDARRNTLFWPVAGAAKIPVRTTTLEAALIAEPHVDLVMIDVEGAEAHVLRGMKGIIESNPQLCIFMAFSPLNLHRAGVAASDLLQEIRAHGLRVSRIDPATGELHAAADAELLSAFSAFLHLGPAE